MKALRKGVIYFFLGLLSIPLYAQYPSTQYHSLKEEGWFPKQSVLSAYQDRSGRLWIGTNAGLYCYNLSRLINYNLSQKSGGKLLNNSVYDIAEDKNGNILVGTESGLGAINVRNGEITRITSTDETINKIYMGKAGNIWFLGNWGNIYRLHTTGDKYKYERFTSLRDIFKTKVQLNDIFQLQDDTYLVGSDRGLFQINLINKSTVKVDFPYQVTSIYASGPKTYLGTVNEGIFAGKLQGKGDQIEFVYDQKFHLEGDSGKNYVNEIIGLDDRRLVVSTPFVVYLSERSNIQKSTKIGQGLLYQREGMINAMLVDREKNIWVGSQKGLYKYRHPTLTYDYYSIEPRVFSKSNQVSFLLFSPEQERLFIATATDGIHALNPATKVVKRLEFPERNIKTLTFTHDKALLINTSSKLYKAALLKNGQLKPKLLFSDSSAQINQTLEVFPGEYWLTSWTGTLIRVSEQPNASRADFFLKVKQAIGKVGHLFCIEKDNQNNVWIGSRGDGIVRVSLKDGKIIRFNKNTNPAASNRIVAIKNDSKGRIWVGTRGDGLLLYDQQTRSFKVFDAAKGLPSNTVCGISEASNGEIWVSTLNGVARYDEDNLIPFQSYGTEDGIYSTEFNFNVSAAANDGLIFFGSGSGIYGIHSSSEHSASEFPLLFTAFTVPGGSKSQQVASDLTDNAGFNPVDSLIRLKHNENSVQITFSALDYTIPSKNKYAYKLIGYDKDWKFAQGASGIAHYYDLPAGQYRFELKSANAGGTWTRLPAVLEFEIERSFWLSKTAMLLYFMALAMLALIAYYLWKKWFRLNDELLREKDQLERQQQQMVFYTDLSHEIKNRLSLILGPLEAALQGKKVNQNVLNNLYGQALRLKKLSDQILNIRKSEYGKFILSTSEKDIHRVLNEVYIEMQPLAILKDLDFEYVPATKTMTGWVDEELLEIIILNLLTNAIKYTNPRGSVRVKAEIQYLGQTDIKSDYVKDGNYLFCSVTDTGIGIPQEGIAKVLDPFYRASNTLSKREQLAGTGIGLDLVSRLIYLHKGWLDIESEPNESTIINFYIPVDKKQYKPDEIRPDKDISIVIPAKLESIPTQEIINPNVASSEVFSTTEKYKILVAEDEEEVRELIVASLSEHYVVFSAANGSAALSLSEKVLPDLILSDLVMPMMDGLTFCRTVRERLTEKYVPFIILTGRNSDEQKLICFQNGVDDFMEKPFSPELLRWRVRSMLQTFSKVTLAPGGHAVSDISIPESADDRFIQDVISIIDKHLDKEYLNVEFLASEMCMSRATFYRKMDTLLSESPSTYIRKYRLKRAAILLASKKYTVSEVSYHVGFNDPNYFAKCFQKEFNTSPSAYSA